MHIEECYRRLGGDYAQVLQRIPSEALVKKFVIKFLEDDSFRALSRAMGEDDREGAFRGSHTLKGVCANLGFEQLRASASNLTELLRKTDTIPAEAEALMELVRRDYEVTIAAIQDFAATE